ncbi:P-loop containing nucleoside triphosphate hydrolase protein, partial [Ochromonadaceae sp. CCMP2298]
MSEEEKDFESLPVVAFKDSILEAVRTHQIVICIGETGSGKTTQIPQFLLDSGILGTKRVAVTQPRRIAAITVAQRVASE